MQTPIITLDTSQSATILATVITLIAAWVGPNLIRRLFNNTKKKTDTGEQRRAVVSLVDVVAAQNETIDEKNREIDELREANSAAQVRINDLRAKLDNCDCE